MHSPVEFPTRLPAESQRRGFTLIELLVVNATVAILIGDAMARGPERARCH